MTGTFDGGISDNQCKAQHFSCGLGSLNSILRPWSVLLLYPCGPITFLRHRLPHMSVTPTCGSVSFPLWHGDACPCDSGGGESVTHANSIGQLYVCLLAISCEPGHSDIGSCPLWFLSLELGEDLTPCLWHRNLMHPWQRFLSQEPSPQKKKIWPVQGHEEYPHHQSDLMFTVA